ncbi:MAG: UDP-N-acetylmuramoyl-tripeptide--D-alanyl-D-alanine ligase [Gammaproteobacteria bacterium]|nr:UDP-N-acetylmuramoyl-tripeptide--D-alanyl-D-alanine ligase [Gammaproteobacteria bacterium]
MRFTLGEIAQITKGQLVGQDTLVSSLSIDTRTLHQGDLFIALVGERFDPHELIAAGHAKLAGALLVEHALDVPNPQIVVRRTHAALQDLAKAWRAKFKVPVVGITGSNGKTSVKELTREILSTQGDVLATQGNLNNHIGVPLTLLDLNEGHRHAVIEMGANHAGEIENLARLASPDIGVISNIGPAHLEGFGSLEGVARAKAELYRYMNPRGIAVVNADEPYLPLWREDIGTRRQVSFGIRQDADVTGEKTDSRKVRIRMPTGEINTTLQVPGQHGLYNALAAAAVCTGLEIGIEDIRTGIESAKPVPGRLVRLEGIHGACVLDDTYNANPASLSVALDVQAQEPGAHWLVLGDMGELGAESIALHKKAGIMARKSGITRLLAVGKLAAHAVETFGQDGEHFLEHRDIIKVLCDELDDQVCVLVKGSRAMRLEKVIEGIRARAPADLGGSHKEHAA